MKLTVAQKMGLLAGSALLGIALLTGLGQQQMNKVFEAANYAAINSVPSYQVLDEINNNYAMLRLYSWAHIATTDEAGMRDFEQRIESARAKLDASIKKYLTDGCAGISCLSGEHEKALFDDIKAKLVLWDAARAKVLALSRANKKPEALAEGKAGMLPAAAKVKEALDADIAYNAVLAKNGLDAAVAAKASALNLSLLIAALTLAVVGIVAFTVTRAFMRQLGGEPDAAADIANRIAQGDLSSKIEVQPGDNSSLMAAMKTMNDALQGLITQMNHMSTEHDKGDIDVAMDGSIFGGSFKAMAEGVNTMVLGHVAVKKKAMACIKEFGEGNFDAPLEKFPGKKAFINDTIETVRAKSKALIADTEVLVQAAKDGKLDVRADASKHQGDFRKIVQGINDTISNIAEPMKVTSNYVDQIAKGVIPAQITTDYKGEYLVIRNNLNGLIKMMGDLLSETDILIQGAAVGELNKRANAEMFQGGWKQLVVGVNDTVKNIAEPMKVTSSYVDQIAKGVIPAQITTDYKGEYLVIRNNLNGLITMMGDLLKETGTLIQGAADGDLNKRANAAQFQGGWNELVAGVNQIIDGIVLPVNEAVAVLSEMEKGDLTQTVNGNYKGQLNDFKNTVNNTIAKLSQVIGEVNGAAASIASASEQVSSTAQSMSQATSEQAASVEETSASVEQMSASINQNTDNAKVTDSMASQAAKQAVEGGAAVKETVAAMKSIAGKIGIIDDIAYQTNLLALNAAIEAARAGEHGKGFAVVAAEVRKLAERSQVAAQEISELASGSVDKAESAGKLLDDIVPAIGKTSELVQEIAAASSEQSSGAGQINTAMTQLNQITQQNASSSEELAATAEEMSGQAAQLQEVMSFFRVGGSQAQAVTNIAKAVVASKTAPSRLATKKAAPKNAAVSEASFVRF